MAMDIRAKEMGRRTFNLAAGDPNLPLQQSIKYAFKNVDLDATHQYGSSQGLPALRSKICPSAPEGVIISNGAKQLIYMSLKAVTTPGDTVILIGPCWSSYMEICRLLGLEYRLVIGIEEDRFVPSLEQVAENMSADVCAIVINTPNNPTGVVYSADYLAGLAGISRYFDCWLISDEIYRDLVFEAPAPSLLGYDNVIYINGFSKSYSLTGWRLGYAIADPAVIREMSAIQSQMSGPPSTLIQSIILGCIDALNYSFDPYRERIELLCQGETFSRFKPDGGFYFYIPVGRDSAELCNYMLDTYGIVMTPGDGYGVKNTVRISIANITLKELDEIKEILFENI